MIRSDVKQNKIKSRSNFIKINFIDLSRNYDLSKSILK